MELKEYLQIIRKHKTLFIATILAVILAAFAFFYLQPVRYDASLTLNITRIGSQQTDAFRYGDFYRLQADEKFAETIVEWLKSPRIVTDILENAGMKNSISRLRDLTKFFRAQKLSSQVVELNFSAANPDMAKRISDTATLTLKKNTESLNRDQKEPTWFEIVPADPVIVRYQPVFWHILAGSIIAGIFLGFWIVLTKHYLE